MLTGTTRVAEPDRAVLTVRFTDIVGSTELASRLGDRRWRLLLQEHDDVVGHLLPPAGIWSGRVQSSAQPDRKVEG